jgi:hypothetical protein
MPKRARGIGPRFKAILVGRLYPLLRIDLHICLSSIVTVTESIGDVIFPRINHLIGADTRTRALSEQLIESDWYQSELMFPCQGVTKY